MRRVNRKVVRSAVFLLGLAVILAAVSVIISPKREIYNAIAVDEKEKSINEEPENTIDVIFMGDSESYSGFSPLQIWAEYGYTSYVCGTSAQRLCDTFALLQHVFEKQSPKAVVLEANCLFREAGIERKSGDKFLAAAAECFPVFQYHSRWKTYFPQGDSKKSQISRERRMKGFRLRKTVKPYTGKLPYMEESDDIREVSGPAEEYIKKIRRLCRENNSELVLVSVPSAKNWNYPKHNGVEKIAGDMGLEYLDLNLVEEIGIDWSTDTKDGGDHLNFEGAKKVTGYMGKYMNEHFGLTDHRGDESYQKWYEDCSLLDEKDK